MSDLCNRWSTEGALATERGETLSAHFDTCPECLAARAAHEAVIARLVDTGQGWQPPGDWEARVMARIAREQPARRFGWWYALFPVLAAAGLALFLLRPGAPSLPGSDSLTLALGVVDTQQVVRGENPKPGDLLSIRVAVGRVAHVAVRIYRDDRTLVYGCGGTNDCPRTGPDISTQVAMDAPGEYRTIVLGGPNAVPAATGSLDGDVARAREAGLQVVLGDAVRVW